ncbi:MAG TPA: hypothetical protein VFF76_08350 [Holophagaceae bacterium]|jgi:hypothetical protein|nr:hypothetical protein [Holophagaceae bacterium]
MGTIILVILAVLVFFTLALYGVRIEENRRKERRERDLPVPVERRIQDRRKKSLVRQLGWVLRSLKSKFTR